MDGPLIIGEILATDFQRIRDSFVITGQIEFRKIQTCFDRCCAFAQDQPSRSMALKIVYEVHLVSERLVCSQPFQNGMKLSQVRLYQYIQVKRRIFALEAQF